MAGLAVQHEGPAQRVEDALGQPACLHLVCLGHQYDEFVAADARDHVAGAHAREQAPARLDQQRVARAVALAVVDVLEVVEVDEQHREPACAGRHLAREAVEQVAPVG